MAIFNSLFRDDFLDIPWEERTLVQKIGFVIIFPIMLAFGLGVTVIVYWFFGRQLIGFLDHTFGWHIAQFLRSRALSLAPVGVRLPAAPTGPVLTGILAVRRNARA
jgi:hypothetical protein